MGLGLCEEAESCSELTSVYKWSRRARERIVLACFSLGKLADIAADWVVVAQLLDGVFSSRADAKPTLVVAVACAVLGTAVEVYGALLKFSLHARHRLKPDLLLLKSLRLNRALALPRFVCDDLPATALGLYLVATAAVMHGDADRGGAAADLPANATVLNVTTCRDDHVDDGLRRRRRAAARAGATACVAGGGRRAARRRRCRRRWR